MRYRAERVMAVECIKRALERLASRLRRQHPACPLCGGDNMYLQDAEVPSITVEDARALLDIVLTAWCRNCKQSFTLYVRKAAGVEEAEVVSE